MCVRVQAPKQGFTSNQDLLARATKCKGKWLNQGTVSSWHSPFFQPSMILFGEGVLQVLNQEVLDQTLH